MELAENKEQLKQYREKAAELAKQLTLEEKMEQTIHGAPAVERLGIGAYTWWNESLHGVARAGIATVFPQAIGLAASFDEDLIEHVADAISTEGRGKFNMQRKRGDTGKYMGITFWAPNVNIFRDPRWGRGHETFGEDPFLTSRLGVRYIQGLQGHHEKYLKAAACAKHFAVHSGPEDGRHSFDATVSKKDMYETYLPAFKACVQEAHVEAVMGAYNRLNGVPCCGNKELLQEILREKWGFQGHVVSDCGAIKDFHEHHGVTDTPVESAAMAMQNGCDLNCGQVFHYLPQAVQQGLVSEERLEEAVTSLFTTRMKLGELLEGEAQDNPYCRIPYDVVDNKSMQELNRKVSKSCCVLLKNSDSLLPLDRKKIKTVGVIGPNANSRKALIGNYEGTASRYVTVLEGIQDYLGEEVRVLTSEGCHLFRQDSLKKAEIQEVCEQSDAIIACMGLDCGLEGEAGDKHNEFASGDKPNLLLPGEQQEALEVMYASGKPVVLVLMSGSALAIDWAAERLPAILQCWYPGAQGGRAIAELLFGEGNPEGKLPVTFYRGDYELPDFADYSMKGRTYRYIKEEALYPFAYGLSYTEFQCSEEQILEEEAGAFGVTVTAVISNTGEREGSETLQVYVGREGEEMPNPQLKGLQKVHLLPGERREVSIHLPAEAFGCCDEEGNLRIGQGCAQIYVGTHGPDQRSCVLTGTKPELIEVNVGIACQNQEKLLY